MEILDKAFFGKGSGEIWFHTVYCDGNEDSIFGCSEDFSTLSDHNDDVGIICSNKNGKKILKLAIQMSMCIHDSNCL